MAGLGSSIHCHVGITTKYSHYEPVNAQIEWTIAYSEPMKGKSKNVSKKHVRCDQQCRGWMSLDSVDLSLIAECPKTIQKTKNWWRLIAGEKCWTIPRHVEYVKLRNNRVKVQHLEERQHIFVPGSRANTLNQNHFLLTVMKSRYTNSSLILLAKIQWPHYTRPHWEWRAQVSVPCARALSICQFIHRSTTASQSITIRFVSSRFFLLRLAVVVLF